MQSVTIGDSRDTYSQLFLYLCEDPVENVMNPRATHNLCRRNLLATAYPGDERILFANHFYHLYLFYEITFKW